MKPTWTYFAADGSYGLAQGLVFIDTSNWDNDDWDKMTYASDGARLTAALQIATDSDDKVLSYVEGVK